jgi:hypothetical protein
VGYPTTDFLKHSILSYTLKIKLNKSIEIIEILFQYIYKAKCQSKCKIYMQDYKQILNYLYKYF